MPVRQTQPGRGPRRLVRRFLLSAFVVGSFIAYALHKPADNTQGAAPLGSANPNPGAPQAEQQPTVTVPGATAAPLPDTGSNPAAEPTATQAQAAPPPTPTAEAASGAYKNGTYTGPEVDAYYGLVQVQAVVQNGKIANVQFLEYPNDRRTSVRINNYAVPTLQQEALQAQNANVDIISGATLTSQAFIESLQPALDQAKQ